MSSCVTRVQKNPSFDQWECTSTVRRQQTGFSKEETYMIKITNGRAKVEKKVEEDFEKETDAHK